MCCTGNKTTQSLNRIISTSQQMSVWTDELHPISGMVLIDWKVILEMQLEAAGRGSAGGFGAQDGEPNSARLSIIHHLKQQCFKTLCAHSLTAQQLVFYMTTGLMSLNVLEESEIFIYVLRGEEEEEEVLRKWAANRWQWEKNFCADWLLSWMPKSWPAVGAQKKSESRSTSWHQIWWWMGFRKKKCGGKITRK